MTKQPKLLFVAGHPRSGTTLLRDIFDSHPDLVITREFRNFLRLNGSRVSHVRRLRKNVWKRPLLSYEPDRLTASVRSGLILGRYVARLLRDWWKPIDAEVVRVLLSKEFPGALIVGDKYPEYFRKLPQLTQIDNACTVVIYRDCRDVVQSTLRIVRTDWHTKTWSRHLDSATNVARNWVQAIELMEQHRDRVHIIRYEELIANPQSVLARLGAYLQVESDGFDQTMIRPTSVGKHKSGLTQEELTAVHQVAGGAMQRLGYT
jgi:hypothetical protein